MGHKHSDEEISEIFSEIDTNGGGQLDFIEFAEVYTAN